VVLNQEKEIRGKYLPRNTSPFENICICVSNWTAGIHTRQMMQAMYSPLETKLIVLLAMGKGAERM
jgi:hypothetical protein